MQSACGFNVCFGQKNNRIYGGIANRVKHNAIMASYFEEIIGISYR